jgi:ribosomal protection tetracycline resistance protein
LLRRTLNLGIVAHVDAGKTTLTERLLYAAGVIDEVGSVDQGTTQTDTLPLEQQRGITIKSAVVSFELDDLTVNLIDTPGHPDFIAEVERVLSVLDGAVLVVSAVEGVQPQTRVLMRALRRLRLPTLIFVNKLDRAGADFDRVVGEISERLTPAAAVPDGGVDALVDVLAENDEGLLAAYVDGGVSRQRVHEALASQSRQALAYPVLQGSALKGVGIDAVASALSELLPAAVGDPGGPLSGSVFKIERGAAGDKIAYVRMFSGTLRTRDVVREDKVTAIAVFEHGDAVPNPVVSGRQIAKVWGLHDHRIGDTVGEPSPRTPQREFPPPTLQSVVVPREADDAHRLRVALGQLAEQDPLINVRDEPERELTVSLYGQVQQEVLEATLRDDFGVDAEFRDTTQIGLRIEPAPDESGVELRLGAATRDIPLYVYKTRDEFRAQMERYVRGALREGLHGWEVVDCVVTMTRCAYSIADGPPSRRGPTSTAADFRKLTPLVLRQALGAAGTVVCEPVVRVSLEVPTRTVGAVLSALARLGAVVEAPSPRSELSTIDALMPVTAADELQRQLPGLSGGEGVAETSFAGYQPTASARLRPV